MLTMQRIGLLMMALGVLAISLPVWAQGQAPGRERAGRANTACFNQKEAEAEAEVRTGIQIRELLRRCAQADPAGQAYLNDWYQFDQQNAELLRNAVALRRAALARIFPNRTEAQLG